MKLKFQATAHSKTLESVSFQHKCISSGFLSVEESDRMQLEENTCGLSTSGLNNTHLQSRIHLQVQYKHFKKHKAKMCSQNST